MSAVYQKMDKLAARAELLDIEERLHEVENRIEELKALINEH